MLRKKKKTSRRLIDRIIFGPQPSIKKISEQPRPQAKTENKKDALSKVLVLKKKVTIHPNAITHVQAAPAEETEPLMPPIPPKTRVIPPEKYFYLDDGQSLRSIAELRDILGIMQDDVWNRFVTNDTNHFANWVEGVFEEYDLGRKIRTTRDKAETHAILSSFLFRA